MRLWRLPGYYCCRAASKAGSPNQNPIRKPISYEIGPWTRTDYGTPIAAEWGQDAPYNNKLPIWKGSERVVTGCGTTAVAQILYHYSYPSSINGKALDWNLMRRHIIFSTEDDDPGNHPPAYDNIATLF